MSCTPSSELVTAGCWKRGALGAELALAELAGNSTAVVTTRLVGMAVDGNAGAARKKSAKVSYVDYVATKLRDALYLPPKAIDPSEYNF